MHTRSCRRNAARWGSKHLTDCLPEALSGRADPDRQGRHQHSLRDLANDAADGGHVDGPQAPAPLVEVAPPIYTDDTPFVPRNVSANDNGDRAILGLPPLRRPGDPAALPAVAVPRVAPSRPAARLVAPDWPGLHADLLTGICAVVTPAPDGLAPEDAARIAAVRRVHEMSGVRNPGAVRLGAALARSTRRPPTRAAVEEIEAYRWMIAADADHGSAAAHRRERFGALVKVTPSEFAARCRNVWEPVAAAAEREVAGWTAGGADAVAEAARVLAGGDDGLEPLWRYHLAAAWVRVREGLPVPRVEPVRRVVHTQPEPAGVEVLEAVAGA